MTFQIGDRVRVKEPFDTAFPDVYTVDGINAETGSIQIMGDRDFSPDFLELVGE